jgi:hypothetical protein
MFIGSPRGKVFRWRGMERAVRKPGNSRQDGLAADFDAL